MSQASLLLLGLLLLAPIAAAANRSACSGLRPYQVIVAVTPDPYDGLAPEATCGAVDVTFTVSASGMPKDVQLVQPTGQWLEQEALRLVPSWKFRPRAQDCAPVDAEGVIARITLDCDSGAYSVEIAEDA